MTRPLRLVELLVLLCAASGVLPLYQHLGPLPKLLLPIAAVLGVITGRKGIRVPALLLNLLSIGLSAYYLTQVSPNTIAGPAANLLASLLAIRLAGERNSRTFLQICGLAIFCLASSTLFTLGPTFLLSLLLLSVMVVCALVLLTFHETDQSIILSRAELGSLARLIAMTTVATVPLMLLFFIILPRTQFPLWNAFAAKNTASAGISDRVEPGRTEQIEESHAVAFRSEMPRIDSENLYWRSVVFNKYSSDAWIRNGQPASEVGTPGRGTAIKQTLFVEPGRFRFLPALDLPVQVRAFRSSTSGDLVTTQPVSGGSRTKYDALSIPGDTIKTRTAVRSDFYLQLPANLPPRLAAVALDIKNRGRTAAERLSLAQEFFVAQGLKYSTKGLPTGKNSLDRFLFDDRQGHCEYFASSFALFMRTAGVPARVVGGYYGGVYNELGGYYAVSEEMAHAWTEVLLDKDGWKRVDPSRWSAGFADIGMSRGRGFSGRVSTLLDTFAYYWDVTVIAYDLGAQLRIARNAGELLHYDHIFGIFRMATPWMIPFIAAAVLFIALPRFGLRRGNEQLALRFIRLSGYETPPAGKGLFDIASEWGDRRAERFAAIYSEAIYRDRRLSSTERRELFALYAALKALKSKGDT